MAAREEGRNEPCPSQSQANVSSATLTPLSKRLDRNRDSLQSLRPDVPDRIWDRKVPPFPKLTPRQTRGPERGLEEVSSPVNKGAT